MFSLLFWMTPAITEGLETAPVVEKRRDTFGGSGLFAIHAIETGTPLITVPHDDVIYGTARNIIVDEIVDSVSGHSDTIGERGIWSISASLACWKLLKDHDLMADSSLHRIGVSPAITRYASTLPWNESLWQLPVLWTAEVLDKSLIHGFDHAMDCDEDVQEVEQACMEAKMRVKNLRRHGDSLSRRLGQQLRMHGLLPKGASAESLRLICQQAEALVFSRTFLHSSGKVALLPTIDCANHSVEPNASFRDTEDGVTLQSTRPITSNEEVVITYGLEQGNCAMAFAGYGFIPLGMLAKNVGGNALSSAAGKGQELTKKRILEAFCGDV